MAVSPLTPAGHFLAMVSFKSPLPASRAKAAGVSNANADRAVDTLSEVELTSSDLNGRPQISDEIAFGHMKALEDIGYRTVGTEEALRGEQYVLEQVSEIASRCKSLKCEVSVQKGSGYHA